MAGPTVKEVLMKFGIDNSNWKKAISELAALLDAANNKAAKAQATAASRLDAQKAKLKEVVAGRKAETAEVEKQIGQAKVQAATAAVAKANAVAKIAAEKAASAEYEKQSSLQKQLQSIQKTLQQEVYTKLTNEKLVTAEINKQNAAIRLQVAQQRLNQKNAGGGKQAGGGFFSGLFGGLGSKFAGTMTSAVAIGELAAHTIEGLIEKTKQFIEESGPLEQVRQQFEKLSDMKGINAIKFLEDLRKATHNLVGDTELYRTANKFMQSGLSLTEAQVVRLTQATVGLARAQGVNATEALNALSRGMSTGYFRMLGYMTGINQTELRVRGLSATVSDHARMQAQLDKAYQVITQRFEQVGEPAITLTEKLKQLQVTTDRAFEAFAHGVVTSRGVQEFFKFLQETIDNLASREGGLEAFGQRMADGFIPFIEAIKTAKTLGAELLNIFQTLASAIPGTNNQFATFNSFMKLLSQAIVLVKYSFLDVITMIEKELSILSFHTVGDTAAIIARQAKMERDEIAEYEAIEAAFARKQPNVPLGGGTPGAGGIGAGQEQNVALERQLSQLRLKGAELDAQKELAVEKAKLEAIKQANEAAYDAGLESLDEYVQRKKTYRQMELQDTLKEIDAERKAKLTELAEKNKIEMMDPAAYRLSAANVSKEAQNKTIAAQAAAQRDIDALDMKGTLDRIEARKKLATAIEAIEKGQVARTRQTTESEFQQGTITAQQYLDQRVKFAEEDYQATKEAEEKKLAENKYSESAQAEFASKMAKAAEDREKALTQLSLSEVEIRTKAIESSYDRAQKLIEGQIGYQQSLSKSADFGGNTDQIKALIEAQISLLKSRLEQEAKSLQLTTQGSEQWFQQLEKIQSTKDALVKYNEELAKTSNMSAGIASAFKELSQAAGKFPKIGAQRVSRGLEIFGSGLEEQAQVRQRMAQRQRDQKARAEGATIAPVTPQEIFASLKRVSQEAGEDIGKHLTNASMAATKALLDMAAQAERTSAAIAGKTSGGGAPGGPSGPATTTQPLGTTLSSDLINLTPAALTSSAAGGTGQAGEAVAQLTQSSTELNKRFNIIGQTLGDNGLVGFFKNLGKNTQTASDDLSNFADGLSSISGQIGGLVSAAKGTGGPFEAGMQGAQAGAGLGGDIGSLIPIPGGQLIGQVAGAAIGGVIGIFSGKAKKEAEKLARQITAQFNAVLTEVQQGTLGLGNAVTAEIATIQSAVDQLSGKKGGRQLLQNMLPQMEQQLVSLQEQQQQVIKSFDTTVEQISAPEAQQALVQPIQAIIQTYQQYILAGGNVATANRYLQASFQNLVSQGLETLNNAEQGAVQNALNYNNLLIERQQLIQDTNQQIQNVMSQGVAVRQMPSGVTKAQQLEQIQLNSQTQLDNLNQQIAVSQHQLSNEQRIFGLAVTRVGLETQLIALQDAQIDKQDASTSALMQEVLAFSGATPTNLPTALSMLGLGGSYISPATEPGLMPTPPVPTGIAAIDEQNQLQYQQALAYYEQQAGLSSTATIGSTVGGIPGGAQGVTLPGQAPSGTTQAIGGALDALASNISAFPQAMVAALASPSTILNVGGPVLTSIASALGATTTTASAATQQSTSDLVDAASARHVIETNISTLSATRVQNEAALVQLKMQEIKMDMARIQAWTVLLNAPASPGTNSATLEDLLQSVYQTRSRQGFGGFGGEVNNPVAQ